MKRPLKFKLDLYECRRCGRSHATWWKTTPPPSHSDPQRGDRATP